MGIHLWMGTVDVDQPGEQKCGEVNGPYAEDAANVEVLQVDMLRLIDLSRKQFGYQVSAEQEEQAEPALTGGAYGRDKTVL
jgi:hypothetical protein